MTPKTVDTTWDGYERHAIPSMTRDEYVRELQRLIAEKKGYTELMWWDEMNSYQGTLHPDEGPTLVPRWPWSLADAIHLTADFEAHPRHLRWEVRNFLPDLDNPQGRGTSYAVFHDAGHPTKENAYQSAVANGWTLAEAISRCWVMRHYGEILLWPVKPD